MIKEILKNKSQSQTVFSFSDIARLSSRNPNSNLVSAVSYSVKKGDLIRLSKGLYALNKNYSKYELANKLRTPSYISLYTVLSMEGVVFQPYTSIFAISNRSETIVIKSQKYIYRKIKDAILLNSLGILDKDGVAFACAERAILDKIYLDGSEHFDNLRSVNWELAGKLNSSIYKSKVIEKFIKTYA